MKSGRDVHLRRLLGLIALAPALATLPSGCFRGGAAFGTGLLFGIAASRAARSDPEPPRVIERVVVVHDPPAPPLPAPTPFGEPATPGLPPSPPADLAAAPQPSSRGDGEAIVDGPFDRASGQLALQRADVAACRARGVPRGHVHALVTFAGTGTVRSIVVDAPPGLTADAVACLGERIGAVNVASFVGADATLGVSWLVR